MAPFPFGLSISAASNTSPESYRTDTPSKTMALTFLIEDLRVLTDANFAAILERKIGWGGRIRTFTVLINSEVSNQLDHAPAGFAWLLREEPEPAGQACKAMKNIKSITWRMPSGRAEWNEVDHKKDLFWKLPRKRQEWGKWGSDSG